MWRQNAEVYRKVTTFNGVGTSTTDGKPKIPMSRVALFDDLLSLAQSMQTCFPHILLFPVEGLGWQWMSRTPRPHSPLRTPMNMTSTTFGVQCWNFYVTRILACSWKRYVMKKIWGGSHFLVISHWTPYGRKNEFVFEGKFADVSGMPSKTGNDETCAKTRSQSTTHNNWKLPDKQGSDCSRLGLTILYTTIMCVTLFWTTLSSVLVPSQILTMLFEALTNRVLPIVPHK